MTTTRPPDTQAEDQTGALDSTRASLLLGITEDGVRKRITKGTLSGYKEHGRWYVYLPDSAQTRQTPADATTDSQTENQTPILAEMRERITSLETQLQTKDDQLQAKDSQIGELHRLMAQTALKEAPARPWWRFW